jgi:hypothetical protein
MVLADCITEDGARSLYFTPDGADCITEEIVATDAIRLLLVLHTCSRLSLNNTAVKQLLPEKCCSTMCFTVELARNTLRLTLPTAVAMLLLPASRSVRRLNAEPPEERTFSCSPPRFTGGVPNCQ